MYNNISNTKTKYFFLEIKSSTYLILVVNKDVYFKIKSLSYSLPIDSPALGKFSV